MHRPASEHTNPRLAHSAREEAAAVRAAQLQRDAALTPAARLEKLAALCRQADLLRGARRLS